MWKQGGVWNGGYAQTTQSSEAKTKRVSSSLQASNGNTESVKLSGMEAESHILASSSGFHPAKTHIGSKGDRETGGAAEGENKGI